MITRSPFTIPRSLRTLENLQTSTSNSPNVIFFSSLGSFPSLNHELVFLNSLLHKLFHLTSHYITYIPVKCNLVFVAFFVNHSVQYIVANIGLGSFHPFDGYGTIVDVKVVLEKLRPIRLRFFKVKFLYNVLPKPLRILNRLLMHRTVLIQ
jgi:hypothetical protein